MTQHDKDITKEDFVAAFMPRDPSKVMEKAELIARLNITLGALEHTIAESLAGKLKPGEHINDCLRGALLRIAQGYGDSDVYNKAWEIVSLSLTQRAPD